MQNNEAWFKDMKEDIQKLLNQKGVIWRGRINQMDLYREWFSSNIWLYQTDWPETSCITCMDAQATGVVPVTNKIWALTDNIFHGYVFDGTPQKDERCKLLQIDKVCELIEKPNIRWRKDMMIDARDSFDWNNVVRQFVGWCQ